MERLDFHYPCLWLVGKSKYIIANNPTKALILSELPLDTYIETVMPLPFYTGESKMITTKEALAIIGKEPYSYCGRCKKWQNDNEVCWYCTASLCVECWEMFGHCGHSEAVEIQAKLKKRIDDQH